MYDRWIKQGLKKPGKSAIGLAKALTKALKLDTPMHRGTIYKMMAGTRKIFSNELAPIAAYLEEPVPNMPTQSSLQNLQTLRVEKELGAGVWREQDDEAVPNADTIVVLTDFEHPSATHFAFRIRGNSMVSAGMLDGDIVICISSDDPVADGKLVVVERVRAGLVETSARLARVYKDRTEFICDGHKPIIVHNTKKKSVENETIRVVAVIRQITRTLI